MGNKKGARKSIAKMREKALNAFEVEGDDDSQSGSEDERHIVKPDDDEEIDSDEALGEDDDFSDFVTREQDSDLSDTGSIDNGELLSLTEVWDRDDADQSSDDDMDDTKWSRDSKTDNVKKATLATNTVNFELASVSEASENELSESDSSQSEPSSQSEDSDNSESSEEFSDSDASEFSNDDLSEEQMANFKKLVAEYGENKKPKGKKKQSKLVVNQMNDSEFAVSGTSGAKISLQDLLGENQTDSFQNEKLQISAPLAKRLQQKLDRAAAYEITKGEVNKWKHTIETNRDAEVLQFPINPAPERTEPSTFSTIDQANDLERKISSILQESRLADEKDETSFENFAPSKLSVEEVQRRRNELRMMRELMFRQEQKARRIKKIKSKSYHRVHKKDKEAIRLMVDGDDEDEEDHDARRAAERMSLKHKTNSKWAKDMIKHGMTKDQSTRSEMEEMLRRGEELRRQIRGSDDSDSDDGGDEDALNSSDDEQEENVPKLGKGVLNMKFMKDAEESERRENRNAREELRRLRSETGFEELEEEGDNSSAPKLDIGRMIFKPGDSKSRDSAKEALRAAKDEHDEESQRSLVSRLKKKKGLKVGDSEIITVDSSKLEKDNNTKKSEKASKNNTQELPVSDDDNVSEGEDEENPWLTMSSGASKKRAKIDVINKDSSASSKSQDKIRKQKNSQRNQSERDLIIDMNTTIGGNGVFDSDDNDGGMSDSGEDDGTLGVESRSLKFADKDMIKRAFAGDDVVDEFKEEKKRKVEEQGDKLEDETLIGWGSWGGDGLAAPTKRRIKKTKGVDVHRRRDATKDNVIIDEDALKVNPRYVASQVPFPYESRSQYERALRMPTGKEWTTLGTHQDAIKPRIRVKQGSIIDPIKAPFKR